MQRLPKLILVFSLHIETFVSIIAFFVIDVIFSLAQVFVILLFIFLDSRGVTANSGSIESLTSLTFAIGTKLLFDLTQSLLWLASISTIILVSR